MALNSVRCEERGDLGFEAGQVEPRPGCASRSPRLERACDGSSRGGGVEDQVVPDAGK
jgi:hypothetical protein